MFKKRWIFTLILICFSLSLFAQQPAQKKEPIEIGAVYNLTGDLSSLDEPAIKGLNLAADNINQAGGILGRPLTLVIKDAQSTPEGAKAATKQLLDDQKIFALIGFNITQQLEYVAPMLKKQHKIIISSGSTSPFITQQIPHYLFLISFTDNIQAAAAAEYLFDYLSIKNTVVLYEENQQYTKNLFKYFTERYEEMGGKILLTETFASNDVNIEEQIKKIKSLQTKPDSLYLCSDSADAPRLIIALRNASLDQPIIGGDSFISDSILSIAKHKANNVNFTTHGMVNPDLVHFLPALMREYMETKKFFQDYKNKYHNEPTSVFSPLAYDSLNLLAAAINNAGKTNTPAVIKALHSFDPFIGVTGKISYLTGDNSPNKTVSIIEIRNTQAAFLGNWIPSKIPAP